jgi:uroporphyrinogen-III synthase
MAEAGLDRPLQGRCIALPEARELDLFAALLQRRGASVLRCPLVDIRDTPEPEKVVDWLRAFNAGACDDLVLFTGEGLRRMLGILERHLPGSRPGFLARLADVRIIARGPKPGRVLRELGIKPALVADPATTPGVIALLRTLELRGRRVGVQLYGSEPNAPLMDFLADAGAQVSTVAPYVYADAAADADVSALIDAMHRGRVDAIAFTSLQQVKRLFLVAEASQQRDVLLQALERTTVAAVGPVVAEALHAQGVNAQVVPDENYYLKPLTQALIEKLGR